MTLIETPVAPVDRKFVRQPQINGVDKKEEISKKSVAPWKEYEKIVFRFFFIYFLIQAVPLDLNYYKELLARDWSSLHFSNIFYLARYTPRFFAEVPLFADWVVIAALAVVGTVTWSIIDAKSKEYNGLYYWLRVIVRYRLAAALLAYGFIKFFPLQMPYPSISNLNTNYGDIEAWKIFSMSTGIVPGYQSFLGLIEILAALLLLNRKTAAIGAFIVLPFTGNVVLSNLAYEGGEYVYSLLLVTFALFIVAYDALRLIKLTSLELPAEPNRYHPEWKEKWQKNGRLILKSGFVFAFVFFYGYKTYASYSEEIYHFPKTAGLSNAIGIYNVAEFRINDQVIPYSPTDPVRWKDVVFEKWATLSIRSNQPQTLTSGITEEIFQKDEARTYELNGSSGRHYYSYTIDSSNRTLVLKNRNKNRVEELTLQYSRPDSNTIILSGKDQKKNSLYVVLNKIDKKYLLEEAAKQGRRRGLKL